MFAMDGSGSVSVATWKLALDFVKTFAESITFGRNETRIGLLTFSSNASVKALLGQYSDVSKFCSLVQETPYLEQSTNASRAIYCARTEIFSLEGNIYSFFKCCMEFASLKLLVLQSRFICKLKYGVPLPNN